MKKFLLALTGASLIALAACGGGTTEPAPAEEEETPAAEEAPQEEAPAEDTDAEADGEEPAADAGGTYDAAAAEALYQSSCIGCHGADMQGGMGGAAPAVTGLSYDAIIAALEEGPGAMPNYEINAEKENLASWLADQ